MNAGAHGAETWDLVHRVETVDRSGGRRWRTRDEFAVGYRSVAGAAGEWFTGAELRVVTEDPATVRAVPGDDPGARRLAAGRAAELRIGVPQPPGDHAGRLVEACGLKGARVGGAVVSEKHGNFIVNERSASSSDIEALIGKVRSRVREETGVDLEPEYGWWAGDRRRTGRVTARGRGDERLPPPGRLPGRPLGAPRVLSGRVDPPARRRSMTGSGP